jgi:hypothetical protein
MVRVNDGKSGYFKILVAASIADQKRVAAMFEFKYD